jgi:hypothetical protein
MAGLTEGTMLMIAMRGALAVLAMAFMAAISAQAGSQSSNTSTNSSSNNGDVRERVIDSYCENGYCQRSIDRRIYRDDMRAPWRYDRRPYR